MYKIKIGDLKSYRCDKIRWILQSGLINKDAWLAGGSLRTLIDPKEEIIDYDIFFKRQAKDIEGSQYNKVPSVRDELINLGFKCIFECPEGKLYTYIKNIFPNKIFIDTEVTTIVKVQLISEFFYYSPEEMLNTFDLTPCLFATDGEYLWTTRSAIKSVKKKIVDIHNITYPVSTLNRIIKYSKKGYYCLTAIQNFVSNLLASDASKYTDESMRVYID